MEGDSLAYLGEIGERTSLRHAVQVCGLVLYHGQATPIGFLTLFESCTGPPPPSAADALNDAGPDQRPRGDRTGRPRGDRRSVPRRQVQREAAGGTGRQIYFLDPSSIQVCMAQIPIDVWVYFESILCAVYIPGSSNLMSPSLLTKERA